MKQLISKINDLKNTKTKAIVDDRLKEFSTFNNKHEKEIFKELCFCIMTANFQAEKSIKIQKEIDDGFLKLSEDKLAGKLKELGHRFPNMRAKFIVEARKHIPEMMKLLAHGNEEGNEGKEKTEKEKREWLAKNIKGLGMKEASHFLRNVGYKNLAILDFHIIDILAEHKIIEPVDKLTPRTYIEIENKLEELCKKTGLYQGELDFYLWFLETGKVLK